MVQGLAKIGELEGGKKLSNDYRVQTLEGCLLNIRAVMCKSAIMYMYVNLSIKNWVVLFSLAHTHHIKS